MLANRSDKKVVVTAVGDTQIRMTRVLHAPRRAVYAAYTEPEQLKRWMGPRTWTMPICEIDLRVGGQWRHVMEGPDGARMEMRGVYQDIVPFERLVTTEQFIVDRPEHEMPGSINTLELLEVDDTTTVVTTILCATREGRDQMLKSGMEHGVEEGYGRLEELVGATA